MLRALRRSRVGRFERERQLRPAAFGLFRPVCSGFVGALWAGPSPFAAGECNVRRHRGIGLRVRVRDDGVAGVAAAAAAAAFPGNFWTLLEDRPRPLEDLESV